mmetsp:Transcript_75451/g.201679  ORF Transcript_75451/g.201679 Transcript_75451/m.201679 type:complete len:239 (-) Transcript_75451:102-818(-)
MNKSGNMGGMMNTSGNMGGMMNSCGNMGGMMNTSGNMGGMMNTSSNMNSIYSADSMVPDYQFMMNPQQAHTSAGQPPQYAAGYQDTTTASHWTQPPAAAGTQHLLPAGDLAHGPDPPAGARARAASSTTATSTPPTPDATGTTLLISKLPESADCKVLKSFLVGSGFDVECATVIRHKDGGSRCFGFVRFGTRAEAAKAMAAVGRPEFKMRDSRTGEMWKVEATWAKADTRRAFVGGE